MARIFAFFPANPNGNKSDMFLIENCAEPVLMVAHDKGQVTHLPMFPATQELVKEVLNILKGGEFPVLQQ